MWYAMVYFPDFRHEGLNRIREAYDPTCSLIEPHLPVMMPVPGGIELEAITAHIRTVLEGIETFRVHFTGLYKSWDHWLLLGVSEGRDTVIQIHDRIYTGVLKPYLREELPYQPHIGLGLFTSELYDHFDPKKERLDEKKYQEAAKEAKNMNLDFWCSVDSFDLIQLNDSLSRLIIKEKFRLNKMP